MNNSQRYGTSVVFAFTVVPSSSSRARQLCPFITPSRLMTYVFTFTVPDGPPEPIGWSALNSKPDCSPADARETPGGAAASPLRLLWCMTRQKSLTVEGTDFDKVAKRSLCGLRNRSEFRYYFVLVLRLIYLQLLNAQQKELKSAVSHQQSFLTLKILIQRRNSAKCSSSSRIGGSCQP